MIQALVCLPLLGALLAGAIALFGAHARHPSGDTLPHDDLHGHDHAHHAAPVGGDASVIHASHDEPGHDNHHAAEPPAAGSRAAELITTAHLINSAAW